MSKIAYVLPVHNEQNNIARCINSLIDQSAKGEVIVFNDASTDSTGRILETIERNLHAKAPLTVYTNEERKGAAWCRNTGNRLVEADIIAVCDVENYYKDRGKAIIEFFDKFPEKGIFYSSLHLRKSTNKYEKLLQEAYEWDFKSKCPISHPTVADRKEVALKYPYHENSPDTDLFEFMLLDAHLGGVDFGGCQNPLLLKIEGNSHRDKGIAWEFKKSLYSRYGVKV
jgi:glycosyltransferase involved in cell wall biosynthesis